jgi:hypothetical protein
MSKTPAFHVHTALADGLRALLAKIDRQLERPLNAYIAGGMAAHLYTANRVTTDVDAEFGERVLIPDELMVEITLEDGSPQVIYLDKNYNSTFALMHEDYLDDAIPVDMGLKWLRVHVLSPVDLAVSKIARLEDNDREDIRALVRHGLVTADEIERRANEAAVAFVGDTRRLHMNIRDAIALARQTEQGGAAL